MIYVVIGQSGSGKTTFVKEHFIRNETPENFWEDEIRLCRAGEVLLFGHYGVGIRTEGTDRIAKHLWRRILEVLEEAYLNWDYRDIVLEGDRVSGFGMLEGLLPFKEDVRIHCMVCSIATSAERLNRDSHTFIKCSQTKALRRFEYCRNLGMDVHLYVNEDYRKPENSLDGFRRFCLSMLETGDVDPDRSVVKVLLKSNRLSVGEKRSLARGFLATGSVIEALQRVGENQGSDEDIKAILEDSQFSWEKLEEFYKELCNGERYVGMNIDLFQERLAEAGEFPRSKLLWEMREWAHPRELLGEHWGWEGVREELKRLFVERGQIFLCGRRLSEESHRWLKREVEKRRRK